MVLCSNVIFTAEAKVSAQGVQIPSPRSRWMFYSMLYWLWTRTVQLQCFLLLDLGKKLDLRRSVGPKLAPYWCCAPEVIKRRDTLAHPCSETGFFSPVLVCFSDRCLRGSEVACQTGSKLTLKERCMPTSLLCVPQHSPVACFLLVSLSIMK